MRTQKTNNASIDIKQDTNSLNHPGDMQISINYFYSSNNVDADKRSSITMMQIIHRRFDNVFNGIGCFEGTFSL